MQWSLLSIVGTKSMRVFVLPRILPAILAVTLGCAGLCAQEKGKADQLSELESEKLVGLHLRYDQAREEIQQKQWLEPMEKLRAGFRRKLKMVQDSFAQTGDLAKALAAQAAVKIDPTAETIYADIKEIAAVQRTFIDAQNGMQKRRDESHAKLALSHIAQLTTIKKNLTKAHRFDSALVLEQEIKKITTNPKGLRGFGNIPANMRKRCSKQDRLQRLADNGGTPACEDAVMNSLRFLQKTQNDDGSWEGNHKVAMTGLALLAYLGHCETPLSEEFGETVTAAITYLVNVSVKQKGKLGDDLKSNHWCYEHGIATYALAESYTFCNQLGINIPNLQESVQDSVQWIINNQHKSGGWEYLFSEDSPRGGDLSIAAWQMQALKAGKATGLEFKSYRGAISGGLTFVGNCHSSDGSYAYTMNGGAKSVSPAPALSASNNTKAPPTPVPDRRSSIWIRSPNSTSRQAPATSTSTTTAPRP